MEPKDYPANIDEGSTKHAQVSTARGKRKKKRKLSRKERKTAVRRGARNTQV